MKSTLILVAGALIALAGVVIARDPEVSAAAATEQGIAVYFSPKGGCERAIVAEIDSAKAFIDLQAYVFTNSVIATALVRAKERGVQVRAVLDKDATGDKYSSATFLLNHGVLTTVDDAHAIAHNKLLIIDRGVVITGRFNFTKAAEERNAENLLIIKDHPKLVQAYLDNFEEHWRHAKQYKGVQKTEQK